jgi:rare lipoprotein A
MGWYADSVGAGASRRRELARNLARLGALACSCLLLANCSSSTTKLSSRVDPKYGVSASPRVIEPGQPVPKGGGVYRVGKPYQVAGVTYTPQENRQYRAEGLASWYGDDFHGRLTANGEIYDMEAISAAHPTMPMPSYARVTNLRTRKSLIVRVNDRGPYHANREIDLSAKAADLLSFRGQGVARVRVEYVGPAPIQGTDDRQLIATLREGSPAPAPTGTMVASNRFLPNFGRPPTRFASAPLPQERPYNLGEGERVAQAYPQLRVAETDSRVLASAALARHRGDRSGRGGGPRIADVSPDTAPPSYSPPSVRSAAPTPPRGAWTQPASAATPSVAATSPVAAASPVTAYAPIGGHALTTGRGLY